MSLPYRLNVKNGSITLWSTNRKWHGNDGECHFILDYSESRYRIQLFKDKDSFLKLIHVSPEYGKRHVYVDVSKWDMNTPYFIAATWYPKMLALYLNGKVVGTFPKNAEVKTKPDGHPEIHFGRMTLFLPFSLYLNDGIYKVNMQGRTAAIDLKRIPRGKLPDGSELPFQSELLHDIWGRASISKLAITVSGDFSDDLVLGERLIKTALSYVNHLLDVYRWLDKGSDNEEAYHITRFTARDATHFKLEYLDKNGDSIPSLEQFVPFPKTSLAIGPDAIRRSPEAHDKIKVALEKETVIPTEDMLRLSAKRNLHQENFRLAILDSNTLFETYVARKLKETANLHGHSIEFPSTLFGKLKKLNESINILRQMKRLQPIVFIDPNEKKWRSALKTKFLIDWHDNTYKIRNEVIHEGRIDVSLDEAKRGFASTLNAIVFIDSLSKINS